MKKRKFFFAVGLSIMVLASSIVTIASEDSAIVENSGYSYLTGRQRSVERNELYAQSELIENEAEREAFLAERGIGETEYSEEAAKSYSYVAGRERGSSYSNSDDTSELEEKSGYSYVAGQQRGLSYRQ